MPDDATLTEIGELMENFVVQGLSVSKKRLYTKPEMGGIGLFGLKDFLTALQCTCVKMPLTVVTTIGNLIWCA